MPINKVTFLNREPDDKEWTAHIKSLNEYTTPDRYLRYIIQYARSGPHYPADMHVDLIEQLFRMHEETTLVHIYELLEQCDSLLRVEIVREAIGAKLMDVNEKISKVKGE